MLVLGIESSCDETAFALVLDGKLIVAKLSSQVDIHALFGGVVPELASREHYRILGPLFDSFMQNSGYSLADLDAIAVTRGPGLLGSLLVGTSLAKALAYGLGIKLIGIDHLKAHILAVGLEQKIDFPCLGLLVSGGHTHLYYMTSPFHFELLGKTLDDAVGEAFDKIAKVLGLPYPGGKVLDELARLGKINKKLFSCPYVRNSNLNFSFSGLKTAAVNFLNDNKLIHGSKLIAKHNYDCLELSNFCASLNHTIAETLTIKTKRAVKLCLAEKKAVKSLIVAGGVAANSMIRSYLQELANSFQLKMILPSFSLCTDNGAMIAYAGYLMLLKGFEHNLNFETIPRGRIIPEDAVSFLDTSMLQY